jgi:pilus assembly protein Flp/PilA
VRLFTDDLAPDGYNLGMIRTLKAFLKDENAATAIEYGLIAAGISVAIISVVKGLGTKLNTTFSSISSQLK